MAGTMSQLLEIGDTITVSSEDYFMTYGRDAGPLTMRVLHAAVDLRFVEALKWVKLMGVKIEANGKDGPHIAAQIRVDALGKNQPQCPTPGGGA